MHRARAPALAIPLLLLALALAAPAATAAHYGPCTHEYFDAAWYAAGNLKGDGIDVLVAWWTWCATHPLGPDPWLDLGEIVPLP